MQNSSPKNKIPCSINQTDSRVSERSKFSPLKNVLLHRAWNHRAVRARHGSANKIGDDKYAFNAHLLSRTITKAVSLQRVSLLHV